MDGVLNMAHRHGSFSSMSAHTVLHTQFWVQVQTMWVFTCTSMWIKNRLGCYAGHQEVSRCHIRGESEESFACR